MARASFPTTASDTDVSDLGVVLMDWFTNAELEFAVPDWHVGYIRGCVLPGLRERGVIDDQIGQMLVRDPCAFSGDPRCEHHDARR